MKRGLCKVYSVCGQQLSFERLQQRLCGMKTWHSFDWWVISSSDNWWSMIVIITVWILSRLFTFSILVLPIQLVNSNDICDKYLSLDLHSFCVLISFIVVQVAIELCTYANVLTTTPPVVLAENWISIFSSHSLVVPTYRRSGVVDILQTAMEAVCFSLFDSLVGKSID